jgi:hypothetical protein
MKEESTFPQEVNPNASPGELDGGFSVPRETKEIPPFLTQPWKPPSKFAKMLNGSINITLRIGPTAIVMWMIAPQEFKYAVRKQARWIPYFVKYAAWWLEKEDW